MRKILTYTLLLAASAVYAVIAKPGSGVYGDEYYHYRLDEKGQITAAASAVVTLSRCPSPSARKENPSVPCRIYFPLRL